MLGKLLQNGWKKRIKMQYNLTKILKFVFYLLLFIVSIWMAYERGIRESEISSIIRQNHVNHSSKGE